MAKNHGLGRGITVKDEDLETQILSVVKKKTEPLRLENTVVERKPEDIVLTDDLIRLAIVALLRGRTFAADKFPVHAGMIILLCKDWREGGDMLFMEHLKQYFMQARRYIPQMPNEELADRILDQVRQYIKRYGLPLVGRIILARMAA